MTGPADHFKINLNQNLWGLVVTFAFLGVAEYYNLCVLFWFSLAPSLAMALSICCTTWTYTSRYVKKENNT